MPTGTAGGGGGNGGQTTNGNKGTEAGAGSGGGDGPTAPTGGVENAEPPNSATKKQQPNEPPPPQPQHQTSPPPPSTNVAGMKVGEQKKEDGKRHLESDSADPDDQEEDEILEESPCKRWSKRREKVKQRDVPGIDAAYLAMDNETGNEVVWNEVLFSERKNFREQEEKIRSVFDHLTRLEHPNLVKFHKYWLDTQSDKPRIIFITEYMSSGSMSRFLQRARTSGSLLNIKAWKNWTRQILSALSYLHSCEPPIVHANLTCNTVFIQQNGLVKIGCVAPNTIHHHVKTFRENIKNIHYLAPEYDHLTEATTQADIYSFGVCALEMATTGALQSGCLNGGGSGEKSATSPPSEGAGGVAATATSSTSAGGGGFHMVTEELMRKAIDSLEDPEQKEFIEQCLEHDPAKRANVAELLNRLGPPEPDKNETSLDEDGFIEESRESSHEPTPMPAADRATSPLEAAPNIEQQPANPTIHNHQTVVRPPTSIATSIAHPQQDGYQSAVQSTATATIATHASTTATTTTTASTSFSASAPGLLQPPPNQQQQHQQAPDEGYHTTQSMMDAPTGTSTPLSAEMLSASNVVPQHRETRQIVQMHAEVLDGHQLRVQFQLDDQMNRQLTAPLRDEDTPEALAAELVQHGFVSEINSTKMCDLLSNVLSEHRRRQLELAARREFGDSGGQTQQQPHPLQHSASASSTSSSTNQSPKHQQSSSVPPNNNSSSSAVASPRPS